MLLVVWVGWLVLCCADSGACVFVFCVLVSVLLRAFFVGYCGVDGGDCVDELIVFSALRFRFGVDLDYNRLAWSFLIWVVDV